MKKKISILLIALLSFSLAACSSAPANAPAADMGERFLSAYGKIEAQLPEMMEIPEDMISDYYGIDPEDYSASLFRISIDNMLADEVIMLQAKDEDAASRIEEMLNERLNAKAGEAESYSPEQYAVITACKVFRDGTTLAMIVSPEHSEMLSAFQQEIK